MQAHRSPVPTYARTVISSALGRRFWGLWASFAAANLGDGFSLVVFPLLAVSLTDDARLVALVSVCRFLPFPLLGLPAGMIIDRFDRRWLAIAAQAGRSLAIGGVAALVWADEATIPMIALAAFVVGAGEVITDGGLPAVVRAVVTSDQLEQANSRLSASQTVANVFIGPPLSALAFELDPALPFVMKAALYALTIVLLATLRGTFRSDAETDDGTLRQRLTRGLHYVWVTTFVPAIMLAMMIKGASQPTWNVVSVTVRQRLVPDAIFGRMMTSYLVIAWGTQPLGALTGGVIAESFGPEWVYVMSATVVGSLLLFGRPLFRTVDRALREVPAT